MGSVEQESQALTLRDRGEGFYVTGPSPKMHAGDPGRVPGGHSLHVARGCVVSVSISLKTGRTPVIAVHEL